MDIGIVLAGYPKYFEWAEMIKARVDVLAACRTDAVRVSGGRISDSTGQLALSLANHSELIRKVESCERFVNGLSDQRERAILIGVWRSSPWRLIAESVNLQVKEAVEIWQRMIQRAKNLYAGIV